MKGDIVDDYYNRQTARQEKYEHRDADAALGRQFQEAFGDDVTVETVRAVRNVVDMAMLVLEQNGHLNLLGTAIARLRRPDAKNP